MDWWDEQIWQHPSKNQNSLTIACTPCQHFSGRGLFDDNKTLWSSWSIIGSKRYYFAGYVVVPLRCINSRDTGYRSVPDGQDEGTVPKCPAFKQIGQKYGPFDIASLFPSVEFVNFKDPNWGIFTKTYYVSDTLHS